MISFRPPRMQQRKKGLVIFPLWKLRYRICTCISVITPLVLSPLYFSIRTKSTIMSSSEEERKVSEKQMPRYAGPPEAEMTEEQRQIRQEILASRKGTGLSGPFGPWLAVPEIARPAQALGKACRYGTSLSFRESELVILLTGAKTNSETEFKIHTGEALKAGLSMEVIDAIPRGEEPFSIESVESKVCPLLENERERAIARFVSELLVSHTVSDSTYNNTKEKVGGHDNVLVELTSIAGYYTYVAYTLNVFRITP